MGLNSRGHVRVFEAAITAFVSVLLLGILITVSMPRLYGGQSTGLKEQAEAILCSLSDTGLLVRAVYSDKCTIDGDLLQEAIKANLPLGVGYRVMVYAYQDGDLRLLFSAQGKGFNDGNAVAVSIVLVGPAECSEYRVVVLSLSGD